MKTLEKNELPFLDEKEEKIESMRDSLYELYKLDWMASHNHSIEEMIEKIKSIAVDMEEVLIDSRSDTTPCKSIENAYYSFETDSGFGGEMWACYYEFLECEYLDETYITGLLDRLASPEIKANLSYLYESDIRSFDNEKELI